MSKPYKKHVDVWDKTYPSGSLLLLEQGTPGCEEVSFVMSYGLYLISTLDLAHDVFIDVLLQLTSSMSTPIPIETPPGL